MADLRTEVRRTGAAGLLRRVLGVGIPVVIVVVWGMAHYGAWGPGWNGGRVILLGLFALPFGFGIVAMVLVIANAVLEHGLVKAALGAALFLICLASLLGVVLVLMLIGPTLRDWGSLYGPTLLHWGSSVLVDIVVITGTLLHWGSYVLAAILVIGGMLPWHAILIGAGIALGVWWVLNAIRGAVRDGIRDALERDRR